MKKQLSMILLTALASTLFTAPANSAVKPGTVCKKLGATSTTGGRMYTCIKSGKKLVWDKGVLKTSGSSKTTAPSNQNIDVRERTYNSLRQLYNTSRDRSLSGKVQIIAHPSTKQSDISEVKARFNDILKFFGDDSSNENFYVILGNMEFLSWTTQELKKVQPNSSSNHDGWENWLKSQVNANNRCNAWNAGSHGITSDGAGLISITFAPNDCTNPRQLVWKTTVEHEVVNHLQNRWFKNRVDLMPCWLNEGQAVYYGSALGSAKNFSEFKEVYAWHKRFKKEDLMSAATKLGHGIDSGSCGVQGGYEAGRLLVEQLVIDFGHPALMAYTKSIVDTPGQDSEKWKVAFEQQFKVSYEKWLEKAVPEIEKRES